MYSITSNKICLISLPTLPFYCLFIHYIKECFYSTVTVFVEKGLMLSLFSVCRCLTVLLQGIFLGCVYRYGCGWIKTCITTLYQVIKRHGSLIVPPWVPFSSLVYLDICYVHFCSLYSTRNWILRDGRCSCSWELWAYQTVCLRREELPPPPRSTWGKWSVAWLSLLLVTNRIVWSFIVVNKKRVTFQRNI
jgi:hypothetical protein